MFSRINENVSYMPAQRVKRFQYKLYNFYNG